MSKPATSRHHNGNAPPGGFRQAIAWLHTWVGLALGWLLFFMFVTGTAGYFDTEIDRWMSPELPPAQTHLDSGEVARHLLDRLEQEAPQAERWFLRLPADRNQPYPSIFWQGASLPAGASAASGSLQLDGRSGADFTAADGAAIRDTGGGQWLYQLHWRLHFLTRTQADVIVGLASLFMLLALITGIVIHKKLFSDFFTFRPRKGQRSWLDGHNILSVLALPFHLMISYSGLVFMGFSYMPLIVAAHYGAAGDARQQFNAEVFDPPGLLAPANVPAPLVDLQPLVTEAERRWGEGRIRNIDIRHPQDANARIVFSENIEKALGSSGRRLVFDGVSGTLLHELAPASSPAKATRDLFIGLHEGLFAPPVLRALYFFSGLMGSGMIATGLVLWTVKRRQRAEKKRSSLHLGLRLVEKLNVATVVGLPIAIAGYFWANRLLPVNLANRADWEVRCLFLVWLAMLLHSIFRPAGRAWIEQLVLAAVAFSALPLLNAATTDRHLGHSLNTGDWVFAGFDLGVLALGLVFGWAARQLRHKAAARPAGPRAQQCRPSQSSPPQLAGEQP